MRLAFLLPHLRPVASISLKKWACSLVLPRSPRGVKTGFFFAATGVPASVLAWFILPEIAQRSPAEIDELFTRKVAPRKFKNYLTDVQKESRVVGGGGVVGEV